MIPLTAEQRNQIEKDTTDGSKSETWHKVRQGRITASRTHHIIRNKTAIKYDIKEDMTHLCNKIYMITGIHANIQRRNLMIYVFQFQSSSGYGFTT